MDTNQQGRNEEEQGFGFGDDFNRDDVELPLTWKQRAWQFFGTIRGQKMKTGGGVLLALIAAVVVMKLIFGSGLKAEKIVTAQPTNQPAVTKEVAVQPEPDKSITASALKLELQDVRRAMKDQMAEQTRAYEKKEAAEVARAQADKDFAKALEEHDKAVRDNTIDGQRMHFLRESSFYTGLPATVASPSPSVLAATNPESGSVLEEATNLLIKLKQAVDERLQKLAPDSAEYKEGTELSRQMQEKINDLQQKAITKLPPAEPQK